MIGVAGRWAVIAAVAAVTASSPRPALLSVPEAGQSFAWSVATNGETAIAGAPLAGKEGAAVGTAHVFRWDGHDWRPDGTLSAPELGDGAWFGMTVQVDGARLVVGAGELKPNVSQEAIAVAKPGKAPWSRNAAHVSSGAVYMFRRDASGWVQDERLVGSQARVGARFGTAVAIDGDCLVVGAPGEDLEAGAVYVFHRTAGRWREEARLIPDRPKVQYGERLAVSGDTLAIGGRNAHGVDVFRRAAGVWRKEKTLTDPAPVRDTAFGGAVAVHKGLIIVAAPLNNDIFQDQPIAHLFRRDGNSWVAVARLDPGTKPPDFAFGGSIVFRGNTAAILGGRTIYRFRVDANGAIPEGRIELTAISPNVYARSLAMTESTTIVGATIPGRPEGANVIAVYATGEEKR